MAVFWPISTRVSRSRAAARDETRRGYGRYRRRIAVRADSSKTRIEGLVAESIWRASTAGTEFGRRGNGAALAPGAGSHVGDKSKPMVAPDGFTFTRRRNISPLPVAASSTFMPSALRRPARGDGRASGTAWWKGIDRREMIVDAAGPLGQRHRQRAGGPLGYSSSVWAKGSPHSIHETAARLVSSSGTSSCTRCLSGWLSIHMR